jgi:hypothetical protein
MSGSETLFWAVRRTQGQEGHDPIFVDPLFVKIKAGQCGPFPAPDLRAAEALLALVEKDVMHCALSQEETLTDFWKARGRFVASLHQ